MHEIIGRRTALLRCGRVSLAGRRYMLTLVTRQRVPWVTSARGASQVFAALNRQVDHGSLACGIMMPDHVHCLITLDGHTSLSGWVGRFKSEVARELGAGCWQRGFYDRLMPCDRSTDGVARYLFLNPYRRRLVSCAERWPWWVCAPAYRPEFLEHLQNGTPPAAWIE
jgi:putative transposase